MRALRFCLLLLGTLSVSCAPSGVVSRVYSTVLRTATVSAAAYTEPPVQQLTVSRANLERPAYEGAECYRGQPLGPLLDALRTRRVLRVIDRHESTTVNLHLELEGGLEVGFKPGRAAQWGWYRHEVLAWHLARLLGLAQVPPAVVRRVPRAALAPYAQSDALLSPADDSSVVEGAVIFWLPELHATRFQFAQRESEWLAWLQPGALVAPEHRDEALELSALLIFDYLQGNADRWNGANLRADEHARVVFRDNDNAWFMPYLANLDWGYRRFGLSQRAPRGLRARVEAASAEALERSVAASPDGAAGILHREQLAAYEMRHRFVVARLRALEELYGSASLLE